MMDPIINNILKAFKGKYSKLNPTQIFKVSNGYLIEAPNVKEGVDYNDPYYFVSFDLKEVRHFYMDQKQEMFKAFGKGAIWER